MDPLMYAALLIALIYGLPCVGLMGFALFIDRWSVGREREEA